MKRASLAILAAAGLIPALSAASASADVIELGAPKSPLLAPTCPPGVSSSACTIILTQVTALETIRDGLAYPTTVTKAGNLVAFTLGLSRLDPNLSKAKTAVHYLNSAYGGTARAGITVLKRVGPKKLRNWTVVAQSPIYRLQPYLGQVAQFPLDTTIPVTPGEVVALTVPTWAPVLSFNLPLKKFAYRQSRSRNCNNPASTTQAQTMIGASAKYVCNYAGTRAEYSVTEVTAPVPPKSQIR